MNYTHIPDVSCFYADGETVNTINTEAHFGYQMILVTGGRSTAIINHKTYHLKEKSLLFISRLERHAFLIEEEPYRRYVASMTSDLILSNIKDIELISVFVERPRDFCHAVALSDQAYSMLLPLFNRLTEESDNQWDFFETRGVGIVMAILIDLYRTHPNFFPKRSNNSSATAVLAAQRYVNDRYSEKITLQDIADQNYISRHALSLAFKEIVGTSFKDYLILFRLTEGKKLLVTTDLSIDEVAERVGYVNVNNFIQIFKIREGQTPKQYRKEHASLR